MGASSPYSPRGSGSGGGGGAASASPLTAAAAAAAAAMTAVAFSPVNVKFMATGALDARLTFWDVDRRAIIKRLTVGSGVTAVSFLDEVRST